MSFRPILYADRIFHLLCEDRDAKRVWIEELHRARTGRKKEKPLPDLEQSKFPPPSIEAGVESSAGIGSTDWGALLSSESDNEDTAKDTVLASVPLAESATTLQTTHRDQSADSVASFDELLSGGALGPDALSISYQQEMRMDPEDGNLYSMSDFIDQ